LANIVNSQAHAYEYTILDFKALHVVSLSGHVRNSRAL
jgi:hypothetical protein